MHMHRETRTCSRVRGLLLVGALARSHQKRLSIRSVWVVLLTAVVIDEHGDIRRPG